MPSPHRTLRECNSAGPVEPAHKDLQSGGHRGEYDVMRNGRAVRLGESVECHALKARAFDWDPIRGSHHGQRPKWLQQQAEYMTAPDHSRKRQIPLASRAPSIHGTQEPCLSRSPAWPELRDLRTPIKGLRNPDARLPLTRRRLRPPARVA